MHHGTVWIHEITLMLLICLKIGMCELKYMGNFITALFIQLMKDFMLECIINFSACSWNCTNYWSVAENVEMKITSQKTFTC